MKKYTTLLFDADDTLLDFSKDERQALEKVMEKYKLPITDENCNEYSKINLSLWKKFERGEIEKPVIKTKRFEMFFNFLGVESGFDPAVVNDIYIGYLSQGGNLIEGAKELCDSLKKKGYDLYLITNGTADVQTPRLERSGLLPFITEVFVSEIIGFQKPKKEFFDKVTEKITEKDKSKILVIGDSLSSDIKGAMNSGLDSIWVNIHQTEMEEGYKAEYTVKNIKEIEKLL